MYGSSFQHVTSLRYPTPGCITNSLELTDDYYGPTLLLDSINVNGPTYSYCLFKMTSQKKNKLIKQGQLKRACNHICDGYC